MRRPRGPVVVFGEVLVDLFAREAGIALADADVLVPRGGGAPANVAVQLARLGVPVRFVSAVGTDPFGARVLRELEAEGVDVRWVRKRADRRTGVTLVEVDRHAERRFFPFRENSADLSFAPADLDLRALRGAWAVHTGTVSLRMPALRAATRALVQRARAAGALVSLDVNLRFGMFPSRALLLREARAALGRADVVKSTREEAQVLLNAPAALDEELAQRLLKRGPRLVMITADAEGALLATERVSVHVGSPKVRAVDATGAGDALVGAALATLRQLGATREGLAELDAASLREVGRAGCVAGSVTVTALGATTAMPRALR